MKIFILITSLLVLPSQLLQANNMVHAATLQNLAAGKVSFRAFLNSRVFEAIKINYQRAGEALNLNPEIVEARVELMGKAFEATAQLNDATMKKLALWKTLDAANGLPTMSVQDFAEEVDISIKDAKRLLRIRVLLTELTKLKEQTTKEKMLNITKVQKISKLLSNYEDLSPYVKVIRKNSLEIEELLTKGFSKAKLVESKDLQEVWGVKLNKLSKIVTNIQLGTRAESFREQMFALYDSLLQEVGLRLGDQDSILGSKLSLEEISLSHNKELEEILHSLPVKQRDLQKDRLYRLNAATEIIIEQLSRNETPNIKQVGRMLGIEDTNMAMGFTNASAFITSLKNLLEQKTDPTVDTEKNFVHDVKQLLHKYGASAFTAEELQELQEAMRIAATAQAAQ